MVSWEFPPKVIGGLGRHVAELSQALAQLDVELTVLTVGNEGDEWEQKGRLLVKRVRDHFPPAMVFPETVAQGNSAMLQGVLEMVVQGRSFDIVHAHDWLTAYVARGIKHGLGIPLIATVHATEYGRHGGLFNDLQRHISDIEWWLTFESWQVICCSQAMHQELTDIFQIPQDKLHVIPNGVPIPKDYDTPQSIAAIRRRYAEETDSLIFFIGRLVHEKGADLLLHAFAQLLASHPQCVLVVAGRGPEEGRLRDTARALGIDSRVRFAGYISDDERNKLYQAAEIAVFPSRYEPFGIVALEAMVYGTPVIAAGVGGLSEVIHDGGNGMLFPSGDAAALARRMAWLLESPGERRRLGDTGKETVAAHYDWRKIAEQTSEVYRQVLQQSGNHMLRGELKSL